jgi:hypothetical protein
MDVEGRKKSESEEQMDKFTNDYKKIKDRYRAIKSSCRDGKTYADLEGFILTAERCEILKLFLWNFGKGTTFEDWCTMNEALGMTGDAIRGIPKDEEDLKQEIKKEILSQMLYSNNLDDKEIKKAVKAKFKVGTEYDAYIDDTIKAMKKEHLEVRASPEGAPLNP